MPSKTFESTVVHDGPSSYIPLPFDPRPVFGRLRAPVRVTLNGFTYRSTIAAMGGPPCIPLRRSHREAAGVEEGQTIEVTLELDTETREVTVPPDLRRALEAAPPAWQAWRGMSVSHRREHVDAIAEAKKPETRARRVERAVQMVLERAAKTKRQGR